MACSSKECAQPQGSIPQDRNVLRQGLRNENVLARLKGSIVGENMLAVGSVAVERPCLARHDRPFTSEPNSDMGRCMAPTERCRSDPSKNSEDIDHETI
jgi:hypothetical protein